MNTDDAVFIACLRVSALQAPHVASEQMECPLCRQQMWIALPEASIVRAGLAIAACAFCVTQIVAKAKT